MAKSKNYSRTFEVITLPGNDLLKFCNIILSVMKIVCPLAGH